MVRVSAARSAAETRLEPIWKVDFSRRARKINSYNHFLDRFLMRKAQNVSQPNNLFEKSYCLQQSMKDPPKFPFKTEEFKSISPLF
jgi:hypothetical protein